MAKKKAPEYGMKTKWVKEAIQENPKHGGSELADLLTKKANAENYDMTFKPQDIYGHKGKAQTKKKPAGKPAKAGPASKPSKAGKADAVQAHEQLKSLNEFFGGKAKTKTVLDLLG